MKKNSPIAIVYRIATPQAVSLARALTNWLKLRGYGVFTAPEQKTIPGTRLLKGANDLGKMALVVVLGGDGTYLRAVRLLQGEPVPILGVNLGSLGFLTPFRSEEVFTAVEHALRKKMEMRPRAMLQITLVKKKKKKIELLALNDAVIERGSLSKLINIEIKFDNTLVKVIKADGIVVASPTGSTAYNLAAGGPILHPEVHALVVTPIAPHSLTSRPTIFPDDKVLSFKMVKKLQDHHLVPHDNPGEAYLVVDGRKIADLAVDDEVYVTRSEQNHYLVKDPNHNYFDLLRQKLKFGDRD